MSDFPFVLELLSWWPCAIATHLSKLLQEKSYNRKGLSIHINQYCCLHTDKSYTNILYIYYGTLRLTWKSVIFSKSDGTQLSLCDENKRQHQTIWRFPHQKVNAAIYGTILTQMYFSISSGCDWSLKILSVPYHHLFWFRFTLQYNTLQTCSYNFPLLLSLGVTL